MVNRYYFNMENKIRHRYSSNNDAYEASQRENEQLPDRPSHSARDSLFSSLQYSNYKGLFSTICLFMILSAATSVVYEHGIRFEFCTYLIQKGHAAILNPSESPTIFFTAGVNLFIVASYIIELSFVKKRLNEEVGRVIIILNLLSVFLFPAILVSQLDPNPMVALIVVGLLVSVFLKLVSYHMVNYWCRTSAATKASANKESVSQTHQNGSKSSLISYPHNLCLKNLYYFLVAPTLCYQLNFPRSDRVRKKFLMARIIEMAVLGEVFLLIYSHWIKDVLHNIVQCFQEGNTAGGVTAILKLIVPLHFVLLIAFYVLFHSFLNFLAEILMFADREYHQDWWDAASFTEFWRKWNVPVHRWCERHIYKPLLLRGFSKSSAAFTVFFVSAIFHEYISSLPLRSFLIWPFFYIIVQLPLIIVFDHSQLKKYGNIAILAVLITVEVASAVITYQRVIPFL